MIYTRKRQTGYFLNASRPTTADISSSTYMKGSVGHMPPGRTLVGKAFRQGFFWPTTLKDACDMVQRCEACQFHSKHTKLPAQALQTIPLTWPFSCWGLDILGPFPRGQDGYRFLFVAIDKFTKWIEATPTGEIKADNAIKFIKGIFCRFGFPHRIIRQQLPVHQCRFPGLLHQAGSQDLLRLGFSPSEQWISRKGKHHSTTRNQDPCLRQAHVTRQEVGRGTSISTMGRAYHTDNVQQGDTLLPRVRLRGHAPHRATTSKYTSTKVLQ